jgi:surface antigen
MRVTRGFGMAPALRCARGMTNRRSILLSFFGAALFLSSGCVAVGDGPEGGDDVDGNYPLEAQKADMPACGTAIGSYDGTIAHSNGKNTGTGYSCNGVGEYGLQYQCVELVMRHFKTHWGLRWYGNAKDLLANAPKDKVDVHMNGSGVAPIPGDMIVWTKGTYGHVALVTAVRSNAIDILEQNAGTGRATLTWDGRRVGTRWGSWEVAGWAHAHANTAGGTEPVEPTPDAGASDSGSEDTGVSDTGAADTGSTTDSAVSWSCGSSAYGGNQYWTCSGGDRYKCVSGTPVKEDCARGCFAASLGKDDQCVFAASGWSCSSSGYGGNQYWTCSGGSLYKCDGGSPLVVHCPSGCEVHALGTNDACR